MSVFNGERFLAEAIESILAQTFGDFEFLILDDGSRDGSRDIYETYAAKDSRIRMIVRENRGLIASLNQLLAEARAPIVARMDADDICLPERFAKQKAFLDANPDHGAVSSWAQDIDEAGNPIRQLGTDHPVTHEDFLAAIENDAPLMCHPSVTFRRDIILSVGGYHAAFRHCEDFDLWLRLATVTRLANIPERLLLYRKYAGQVSIRHATEMHIGHAVAMCAYYERLAGRPDPTENLDALPALDELDALFARPGIARIVREGAALALRYSRVALGSDGFELILRNLKEGGSREGMWRTVARLVRFGEPARALRLVATLASG